MDKMNQYLSEISKIFGYEYNELFFSYLKSISLPNHQVCNKRVPEGEGGWKCYDCEIDTLSLICNNCFSKCKHKHNGHKISFDPGNYGFCDCGDPNVIVKEGFCPDHQGPFTNMNDLYNFIKKGFDEKILDNIDLILNKIFNEFISKITFLLNTVPENEEYKKNDDELYEMIDKLISFCESLYENNLGLFYFVSLKFTQNFPFETNHRCFNYYEEENQIKVISENLKEKHNCICPFFQILINIFMRRKTNHDTENFFTLFIQNYKNKLITSLSFMHSLIKLFENKNLEKYRGMAYQLMTDQLADILYDEKNIFFLQVFYYTCYIKIKELLDLKLYEDANNLINRVYEIIKYLPKLKILDKIKSNLEINRILIDIVGLTNNLNTFENKIKFTIHQRDGFLFHLFNCELYCLLMSELISLLIDYDNLENLKYIFNKIILKLYEDKQYKESLSDKIFSPHIDNIRIFSIFLNRFCFHYSIKNNCDLLDSFQHFQELFPDIKELSLFIFKELINFFGFFISQKYSFFSYFGADGMKMYYVNYFSSRIYINCDITLMKYLLTIPEIQIEFNIYTIASYSNIDSSNDFFLNIKESDLSQKNEELMVKMKNEEKNLKYINSIFEFLLQIIRNDLPMINLAFKFSDNFRMKKIDNIFDNLVKKEQKNIENMITNKIIHHILGKKNIVQRESCMKLYKEFTSLNDNFDKNLVDNLLKENCDEISSPNQLKQFSLKKKAFQFCDIDYILDTSERSNAVTYLLDFQSNNHNTLNTYISKSLSIQERLNNKVYESFYNTNNLEYILNFYRILVTNSNYPIFTETFFFTFSKILCFYIKLSKTKSINEEYMYKILEIINNNKIEGLNYKSMVYIKKLLSNENDLNDNKNRMLEKSKNLRDKFKRKFDEHNQSSFIKYSSSTDLKFDDEESISSQFEEICVYCRQPLNNEISNYYGDICYLIRDFFIDIIKKKEKNKRLKSSRIVTCNHKIHFDCYIKYITKYLYSYSSEGEYQCPLCKKLSNIMICNFNYLIEKDKNLLKGMIFEKENINDFYINNNNDEKDSPNNNNYDIDKYRNFIIYNQNFFEFYCSKLLKKGTLVNDINANSNLFEQIYEFLLNDFDAFNIYYNVTNYKKEQIEIWKNILLTIRLLCKFKIINCIDFLILKFNLVYNIIKNLDFSNTNYCQITSLINEFIFCLFIIYDINENIEKIKNIFKIDILVYLFKYYYLKSTDNNFNEFLFKKENEDLLKKIYDLYILKYKIYFLLCQKEENINLTFEEAIQFLKEKEYLNSIKNIPTDVILKENNLGMEAKFPIIELPENYLEFCSKYMNVNCANCGKKDLNYYICLVCGSKICDNKNCVREIASKGTKEYSLIVHSKECGGGNILFIANKNSQIIYCLKRMFTNTGIYVYLNSFGEYIDYYLNDNYVLNKNGLEKSIQTFIDLTFRKRGYKVKLNLQLNN